MFFRLLIVFLSAICLLPLANLSAQNPADTAQTYPILEEQWLLAVASNDVDRAIFLANSLVGQTLIAAQGVGGVCLYYAKQYGIPKALFEMPFNVFDFQFAKRAIKDRLCLTERRARLDAIPSLARRLDLEHKVSVRFPARCCRHAPLPLRLWCVIGKNHALYAQHPSIAPAISCPSDGARRTWPRTRPMPSAKPSRKGLSCSLGDWGSSTLVLCQFSDQLL